MIKKLVTTGAAAGLLLASAVPAFALFNDELVVNQGNTAVVTNSGGAISNTGLNHIGGGKVAVVWTGGAQAQTTVDTVVNKNVAIVH